MSKNLKRVAALVLALSMCISMFAMVSAEEQAYKATITGWSSSIDSSYTWFADGTVTDAQKDETRSAIASELAYQNDVLGFKIGTSDSGTTTWVMSSWGGMAAVQIENYKSDVTDNTGNPWGDTRRWAVITAPFVGMAFSVKGDFAANYTASGYNPALSNEFTVGDTTYQVYWNGTTSETSGTFSTNKYAPGIKNATSGKDLTNNKFRYAVASYNQQNKESGADGKGLTVGYPSSWTIQASNSNVIYQSYVNPNGTAYVATRTDLIDDGELTGAYVITGDLATAFDSIDAENTAARFAITGAPLANAVNGTQAFENGTLTKDGFKSNACSITSFSINGEPTPAVINEEDGTISAFVTSGTSVSSLNPTITYTGTSITPNGAQNFTNEVSYTVTAEDGTAKIYKVKVYQLTDADIIAFVIDGVTADINYATKTITAVVSGDYDLTKATPVITTLDSSAVVSPASGASADLSSSWANGVSYKSTKGSASSTYTVRVRNKSKDTSITSFVIPDGQLKYQDKKGAVVATISDSTINLEFEYGNTLSQKTTAEVTLADGASISPDPSAVKRMQSGQEYVVTAEAGNTKTYKVKVTVSTEATFEPVTADDLNISVNFMTSKFSNDNLKSKAKAAVLDEYNNQRSMGVDLGTPVGKIEGWDSLLNRQFFTNGYGLNTSISLGDDAYGSAMITMDVPNGKAYTIKNQMLSLWQGSGTGDNGSENWLFASNGSAAVNEFTMDGKTYQQFAYSYAYYNNSNTSENGVFLHGIGTFGSSQVAGLKTSSYYSYVKNSLDGEVQYSFRQAYERANLFGYNPGIADGASTDFVSADNGGGLQYLYLGQTDQTFRDVTTANSKGIQTTVTEEGTFDNYLLYQVFTGSGDPDATTRDSSNKTIIIKGTNALGVDNGGGIALFNTDQYRIKDMYEALDGVKVPVTIDGISFTYNRTLGTPTNYTVDRHGNVIMSFVKNTVGVKVDDDGNTVYDDDGNPVKAFNEEEGYYIFYNGDPNKYEWIDGNYLSDDNTLSQADGAVQVDDSNAEVMVVQNGDVYPVDDATSATARTFTEDAIYINYSKDATVDVSKIQFTKLTTSDEEAATIVSPEIQNDGTYATLDCSISGQLRVKAEDESVKLYSVYIYQDGKLLSSALGIGDWSFWTEAAPVTHDTYPYFDDELGKWVYDTDPNASLKDENGKVLWDIYWGYYINNDTSSDSNFIKVAKYDDWGPSPTYDFWKQYYLEHYAK